MSAGRSFLPSISLFCICIVLIMIHKKLRFLIVFSSRKSLESQTIATFSNDAWFDNCSDLEISVSFCVFMITLPSAGSIAMNARSMVMFKRLIVFAAGILQRISTLSLPPNLLLVVRPFIYYISSGKNKGMTVTCYDSVWQRTAEFFLQHTKKPFDRILIILSHRTIALRPQNSLHIEFWLNNRLAS